ncbi:hypothetical protein MBLNU230_g7178t1 [Neophaeotheca triangularis]
MPYLTVPTTGHTLHYHDTHPSPNPPSPQSPKPQQTTLLLLHGLGSSQNYYHPLLPSLPAPQFRCLSLDTHGAGRSLKTSASTDDLSMEFLAQDVVGVCDVLGLESVVLVGHSMGATLALAVAALWPRRVRGVVALGPVSPGSVKGEVFAGRVRIVLKDGMEPLADTIPTAATNSASTPLQRAMIRELLLAQDPKAYASHCNVIVNAKEPEYAKIQAPVLVLAGDEDKSAPLEGCRTIMDGLRDRKELKVLEGVGHWHCIEAGDRVGEEVARFCRSL